MATKIIYFIRHGETILNAEGLRQGADGSLSDRGKAQALETANKFPKKKGRPQVVVSSTFERARETALIVGKALDVDVEYSELLVERRNPSQVIGQSEQNPNIKRTMDMIDRTYHDDNARVSDEENFVELRDRAKKLLDYVVHRREKRIVMVTHGYFLKMVAAYVTAGESLTSFEYNKLSFFNPIDNAGLTIFTCKTSWFRKPKWQIIMWNGKTEQDFDLAVS